MKGITPKIKKNIILLKGKNKLKKENTTQNVTLSNSLYEIISVRLSLLRHCYISSM